MYLLHGGTSCFPSPRSPVENIKLGEHLAVGIQSLTMWVLWPSDYTFRDVELQTPRMNEATHLTLCIAQQQETGDDVCFQQNVAKLLVFCIRPCRHPFFPHCLLSTYYAPGTQRRQRQGQYGFSPPGAQNFVVETDFIHCEVEKGKNAGCLVYLQHDLTFVVWIEKPGRQSELTEV